MRKNFGAKPYLFPQPVMIIGTYDTVHFGYYRLGEKVGNAFKDGAALK